MALLQAALQFGTTAPLVEDNVGVEVTVMTSNRVSLDNRSTGDMLRKSAHLNDEDEEDIFGESSFAKDKNDSTMDVDENELLNLEDKENISKSLKRLSRKELEDLVLSEVVEAVVKHSRAGKLQTKVLEMQLQKDKLVLKVASLQKQFQDMSKALKILLDNQDRDPNLIRMKVPPRLKQQRSVGLQVALEPPCKTGPTKFILLNEAPINGFKTVNIPQKRLCNEGLIEEDVKPQVKNVVRVIKGQGGPKSRRSAVPSVSPATSPIVVDLTDDSNTEVIKSSQKATTNESGLFKIFKSPPPPQIVPSSTKQSYQVVTTTQSFGQFRPILLAQNNVPSGFPQLRPIQVSNLAPRPSTSTGLRQPRPMISTTAVPVPSNPGPSVAARIAPMLRAPIPITPRSFQLPALPLPTYPVSIPKNLKLKELPPKPNLTLSEQSDGIVLSWTFKKTNHSELSSYQIYTCQEALAVAPGRTSAWKKVGDVKALPLPMSCTLSQFTQGNRYFFILRGVDIHGRSGLFCDPVNNSAKMIHHVLN